MKKDAIMQIARSKATKPLTVEEEAFLSPFAEAIESATNEEAVERGKVAANLEAIAAKLGDVEAGQTMASIVRGMAQTIDDMDAKAKRGLTSYQRFNLMTKLEEKKDVIQRARKSGEAWEIEFHAKRTASGLMTAANTLTGATAFNNPNLYDDMDVVFIQYPKNFIIDAINSKQVSKVPANWKWKEQIAGGVGVPTVVTEGSAKPLVDYKFEWKYATRAKYAARIEVTEEEEMDFEQLQLSIINMFERDVITVWQNAIYALVIAYATTYVSSAMDGTLVAPSVYSVIGALKLAVQAANYEPDIVIMNPGDAAQAIYSQTSTGQQQFIPESLQFAGLRPYFSNLVTIGTIIVGTSSTIQEQHGPFIIRKGVTGTQFYENESTIIGEIFTATKMPTASKASWAIGDVATMKQALTANPAGPTV